MEYKAQLFRLFFKLTAIRLLLIRIFTKIPVNKDDMTKTKNTMIPIPTPAGESSFSDVGYNWFTIFVCSLFIVKIINKSRKQ